MCIILTESVMIIFRAESHLHKIWVEVEIAGKQGYYPKVWR